MEKQENNFLDTMRHSCAHVMAEAVQQLFKGTKLGMGPSIDNGFYYDFESTHKFVPEDLPKIEKKMKEIIKSREKFECHKIAKKKAVEFFAKRGEKFKVELIKELKDGEITYFESGNFVDLCKGPHLEHTGQIKHFKLTHVAGAYWRGDENKPMLQRIYGIAFQDKGKLNTYLTQLEEAKKRDHRKLGQELKLFSLSEDIGPGLILWHPKGGIIRTTLQRWLEDENMRRGYKIVYTPHIARRGLWETSGHTNFYSENMFAPMEIDNQKYQIKPMNCPFHIGIYKSELRSYRDLPFKLSELGTVYRYERSGVLHGLLRVRGFTLDDAHIFCTPEQIDKEVQDSIDFVIFIMKTFGFKDYKVELSIWDEKNPKKYVGTKKDWNMAQKSLENVLKKRKIPYKVEVGEAAFYGPKIDIKLVDAIKRTWQLSTIQFDFNLPTRFNLEYVGKKGRAKPYMVHRALFGSIERFVGILIEHYAGQFPLWLNPVQVKILTLTDKEEKYAKKLAEKLQAKGIRVEMDLRAEKLGLKIRETHGQKVGYTAIIGGREAEENKVAVRLRSGKNQTISLDDFVGKVAEEIKNKDLEPTIK